MIWHKRPMEMIDLYSTQGSGCKLSKGRGKEEWERVIIPKRRFAIKIRLAADGSRKWTMMVIYSRYFSLNLRFVTGIGNEMQKSRIYVRSGPNEHWYFHISLPKERMSSGAYLLATEIKNDPRHMFRTIQISGQVFEFFFNLRSAWTGNGSRPPGNFQLWVTGNREKAMGKVERELSGLGMGQCEAIKAAETVLRTIVG